MARPSAYKGSSPEDIKEIQNRLTSWQDDICFIVDTIRRDYGVGSAIAKSVLSMKRKIHWLHDEIEKR